MNNLWIEVKKIFKRNYKIIILVPLILGAIFTSIILYSNSRTNTSTEGNNGEELLEDDQSSLAYFQFYIEREDGTGFTNLQILQEFFNEDKILNEISQRVGTPVENILIADEEIEEENLEDSDLDNLNEEVNNIVTLNLFKGQDSHLYTFTVSSEKLNDTMEIANFYHDLLIENRVPFLQDKNIYILVEPQIMDKLLRIDDTLELEGSENSSVSILSIVGAYILALVLVISFIFVCPLFSKKLIYSFSYLWDENHSFLLYDRELDNEDEVKQFVRLPKSKNKIVLSENEISPEIEKLLSFNEIGFKSSNQLITKLHHYKSLIDIELDNDINEIIVLINEEETTRNWYNKQRKLYPANNKIVIKVLQINQ